jgi:hypothetical protein
VLRARHASSMSFNCVVAAAASSLLLVSIACGYALWLGVEAALVSLSASGGPGPGAPHRGQARGPTPRGGRCCWRGSGSLVTWGWRALGALGLALEVLFRVDWVAGVVVGPLNRRTTGTSSLPSALLGCLLPVGLFAAAAWYVTLPRQRIALGWHAAGLGAQPRRLRAVTVGLGPSLGLDLKPQPGQATCIVHRTGAHPRAPLGPAGPTARPPRHSHSPRAVVPAPGGTHPAGAGPAPGAVALAIHSQQGGRYPRVPRRPGGPRRGPVPYLLPLPLVTWVDGVVAAVGTWFPLPLLCWALAPATSCGPPALLTACLAVALGTAHPLVARTGRTHLPACVALAAVIQLLPSVTTPWALAGAAVVNLASLLARVLGPDAPNAGPHAPTPPSPTPSPSPSPKPTSAATPRHAPQAQAAHPATGPASAWALGPGSPEGPGGVPQDPLLGPATLVVEVGCTLAAWVRWALFLTQGYTREGCGAPILAFAGLCAAMGLATLVPCPRLAQDPAPPGGHVKGEGLAAPTRPHGTAGTAPQPLSSSGGGVPTWVDAGVLVTRDTALPAVRHTGRWAALPVPARTHTLGLGRPGVGAGVGAGMGGRPGSAWQGGATRSGGGAPRAPRGPLDPPSWLPTWLDAGVVVTGDTARPLHGPRTVREAGEGVQPGQTGGQWQGSSHPTGSMSLEVYLQEGVAAAEAVAASADAVLRRV